MRAMQEGGIAVLPAWGKGHGVRLDSLMGLTGRERGWCDVLWGGV